MKKSIFLLIYVLFSLRAYSVDGKTVSSEQIFDAIQRFEAAEQVCSGGVESAQNARKIILRNFDHIVGDINAEFRNLRFLTKEYNKNKIGQFVDFSPPNSWKRGEVFSDFEAWKSLLASSSAPNRCKLLHIAYLYSIWVVTKLEPSKQYNSVFDLLLKEDAPIDEVIGFKNDQLKVSWSFRYLTKLDSRFDCPLLKGDRTVLEEARLRESFAYSKKLSRFPLGFAIGMCGRPMNSHYIDDLVTEEVRPDPWVFHSPEDWEALESKLNSESFDGLSK